jgi:hypothetical protein
MCEDMHCSPSYKTICTPVMGKLKATPPFEVVRPPKVTVSEPNWDDIPTSFFGLKATYRNCSSERQSFGFNQTQKLTIGTKVSKSKTIKVGREISASVGFEFSGKAFGGKSDVAVKFSNEVSTTDAKEDNAQTEQDFTYSQTVNVPVMSMFVFKHEFAQHVIDVPYSGTVILDGPIAPNKAGISRLSQVLTTEADRTFDFAGVVSSSNVYQGITDNVAQPLTEKDCQLNSQQVLYEPYLRGEPTKPTGGVKQ